MKTPDRLDVHLAGSIPLAATETVFRTVSASFGPHLRRIPDGETGPRRIWVGVASECGLGRTDPARIDSLFASYRRMATAPA